MNCATPLVLAALSGNGPVHHPGVVATPFVHPLPAPPDGDKTVYGTRMSHHLDSENFTVAWTAGDQDEAAQRVSDALEAAWSALVERDGWVQPASSEDYLLWVVLDRTLSHTGYTTLAFDETWPDGVPVTYLNPVYAEESYGTFWEHLAVHEFAHMLQYAVREYDGADDEAWYWEASAEWSVELATPELDVYAVQTRHYAEDSAARFDTVNGAHEYGMSVLNAWLEEHALGEGGLLAVWTEGDEHPRDDWRELLEDLTGQEDEEIWAGFTAALATGDLREAHLYATPTSRGTLVDGAAGALELLGTDYWLAGSDALVSTSGGFILGSPSGIGSEVVVAAGEPLTVTSEQQSGSYVLTLQPVPEGADSGDSGATQDSGDSGQTTLPTDETGACGCRAAAPGTWLGGWLVLVAALQRRRTAVAEPEPLRV